MPWWWLLVGLMPLVAFVLVDMFAGLRWGVVIAIILALVMFFWSYFYFGVVDSTTIADACLILILGLVTLKMNNAIFFKFQPVVVGVLFAAYFMYFQLFKDPVFVRMLPMMAPFLPEETREIIKEPLVLKRFAEFSAHMIFVFLIHAVLVAYCALKRSNLAWLLMRGLGIYIIMLFVMAIDVLRWSYGKV